MKSAEIRIKLRHFFKKYGRIILIALVIIFLIIAVDRYFKNSWRNEKPSTTYNPDVPIMDGTSSVPKKVQKSVEDFIADYINYCNNGEYEKAYNLLSKDCKESFFVTYADFVEYVKQRFKTKRCYAIQSYSIFNKKYVYSLKLFDDFLGTGLTNSKYQYYEEQIVASYDEKNNIVFSIGGFIEKNQIQSVQENEYLKADVLNQLILYDLERYSIKLTNRSDKRVVIQDGKAENHEIVVDLGDEVRRNELADFDIILEPGESKVVSVIFSKRYDNGETSKGISLTSVRVYDESDNLLSKFSVTLGF